MPDPDRQSELTHRMVHRYTELATSAQPAGRPNAHTVMAELAEVVRRYDGEMLTSLRQQMDAERAGFRGREQGLRDVILQLVGEAQTVAFQAKRFARTVGLRFPEDGR